MEPVPMLLAMTYRAMGDQFHDRLRQIGLEPLRPAHGYVFRFLKERRATTVDIGQPLGVTKQAAAKIVNELDEWGYVLREPHPMPRRASGKVTRRFRRHDGPAHRDLQRALVVVAVGGPESLSNAPGPRFCRFLAAH